MINFSAGVILQPPIKPSSVPQGIPIQHLKDGFQFQIHQTHGNFYWNFLTGHISHHNPQKQSEVHGISRFLWDFHGISMGFPWDFQISMSTVETPGDHCANVPGREGQRGAYQMGIRQL
jgi:hypothetical protein